MADTSGPNEQWPLHNVVAAMIDLSRIFERQCGRSYNDHHDCVGCTRRSECREWEMLVGLLQGKARELRELQDEVDVRRRESADRAWYWQGDGEDYPESLVCPVIMSAETLRGHLAQLAEKDKKIAELRKALEHQNPPGPQRRLIDNVLRLECRSCPGWTPHLLARDKYDWHRPGCQWALWHKALAADAGKAVTEDEIEEAAAQEITKQLAAGAGKGG